MPIEEDVVWQETIYVVAAKRKDFERYVREHGPFRKRMVHCWMPRHINQLRGKIVRLDITWEQHAHIRATVIEQVLLGNIKTIPELSPEVLGAG